MLDTLILTCIGVLFYALTLEKKKIYFAQDSLLPIAIMVILCIYSFVLTFFYTIHEYFYVLKFARTIVNFLGVYTLVYLYFLRYGLSAKEVIIRHLFWVTVVHAVIMVLQFTVPSFRDLILTLTAYSRPNLYRATGLTVSYNTTNLVQGIGLLIAVMKGKSIARGPYGKLFGPATIILILSMAVSGRSAFLLTLLFVAVLIFRKILTGEINPIKLITPLVLVLLIVPVVGKLINSPMIRIFLSVTLVDIVEPIESLFQTGSVAGTKAGLTFSILRTMYFLPDNPWVLIFGSTLLGRNLIHIYSDSGYVLTIFGIGIVGLILILLIYSYFVQIAFKWNKYDWEIGFLLLFINMGTLILSLKEKLLLTRHVFTITILLVAMYYIYSKRSIENANSKIKRTPLDFKLKK